MTESKETVLSIIQDINNATEPGSVTNKMVATVFNYFAGKLVTEETVQQLLTQFPNLIKRMQGRAEEFDVNYDPVKHVEFQPADGESIEHYGQRILTVVNEYIDSLHGTAEEAGANGVPHGLVCLNVWGGRIWMFNTPMSYADDIWAQIVVNAACTDGKLNVGNGMWHRHREDGEWKPWTRFIDSGETDNLTTKVNELETAVSKKQNIISDLATIRNGAKLGATAVQQHQNISGKTTVIDLNLYKEKRVPTPDYNLSDNYMPYYTWDKYPILQWGIVNEPDDESHDDFYYVGKFTRNDGVSFEYFSFSNKGDWGLLGDNKGLYTEKNVPDVLLEALGQKPPLYVTYWDSETVSMHKDSADVGDLFYKTDEGVLYEFYYDAENEEMRVKVKPITPRVYYNESHIGVGHTDEYGNISIMTVQPDVADDFSAGLMSSTDKSRLDAMYQYGKSKGWWS